MQRSLDDLRVLRHLKNRLLGRFQIALAGKTPQSIDGIGGFVAHDKWLASAINVTAEDRKTGSNESED